jgi:peptidoglycan/xylan/chitin deacetylase (PgdA/CDA1 family)
VRALIPTRPPIPVLAYHGVGPRLGEEDRHNLLVTPGAFEAQMAHLAEHHTVVPLGSVAADDKRSARRPVVITFDDAYRCVLIHAAPILRQYGFPATVFVPTAWIGRSAEWNDSGASELDVMTERELRDAEAQGITAESHGCAHIDYSRADPEAIEDDLQRSVSDLTRILGRRPRFVAYPYGRSSPAARSVVARLGFDAGFSIDRPHDGPFAYGRSQITPLDGRLLFWMKANGVYNETRWSPVGTATWAVAKPVVRRLRAGTARQAWGRRTTK